MASILKVTEITTPDGTGNITVSRPLSSVQLGGVLDVNGNYVQTEKGGDIASASPLVIDTDGDYFDVTGTTNFAAMTVAADRQFTLQFDGALTMTHHATNLDLPGEANITTAAGDVAVFQSTGANTVQCINYTKADGTGVVSAAGGKVLQVVGVSTVTEVSSSSTTYADFTDMTASITPSNTANKVMVIANVAGCVKHTENLWMILKLLRDSTSLGESDRIGQSDDTETRGVGAVSLNALDSPSSVSSLTYKVQLKASSATTGVFVNGGASTSTILLLEIDGT
jgi:hypothetical protein